jgi:hypothetical protein
MSLRNDVMYRQVSAQGMASDATAIDKVNLLPGAASNITGDPMLDTTWHLAAGSPCVDKGTASEAPPADYDGEARPMRAEIDIGHDEMQ